MVYCTPVQDIEYLRQRMEDGCQQIENTPGIFERVRQSMIRRAQLRVAAYGGHFEYLLCFQFNSFVFCYFF